MKSKKTTKTKKPAARKAKAPVKAKKSVVKKPALKAVAAAPKEVVAPKKVKKAVKRTNVISLQKPSVNSTSNNNKAQPKLESSPSFWPLNMFHEMEKIMMNNNTNFQFDQIAQDTMSFSRESMEAFVQSSTMFAKGMEDMMRTAASLAQGAMEKQAEQTREIMGSKSINEFTEKQTKIVQSNFDEYMQNTAKLSEMGVKVLNECTQPINEQMTKAMKKAKKAA